MRYISCDIEDNIAIVQINNPPVNELSVQVIKGLDKTLDLLSEKNDIKVVIITGKGRFFCTGVDIKEIAEKKYLHFFKKEKHRSKETANFNHYFFELHSQSKVYGVHRP